jgi:hypothetical protein
MVGYIAVLQAEVTGQVVSEGNAAETFSMPMTQVWVQTENLWKCLAGHAGPRRP